MDVALDAARHHELLAVVAFGVHEQRGDQQRQLHHLTEHGVSPWVVGAGPGAELAILGGAGTAAIGASPAPVPAPGAFAAAGAAALNTLGRAGGA